MCDSFHSPLFLRAPSTYPPSSLASLSPPRVIEFDSLDSNSMSMPMLIAMSPMSMPIPVYKSNPTKIPSPDKAAPPMVRKERKMGGSNKVFAPPPTTHSPSFEPMTWSAAPPPRLAATIATAKLTHFKTPTTTTHIHTQPITPTQTPLPSEPLGFSPPLGALPSPSLKPSTPPVTDVVSKKSSKKSSGKRKSRTSTTTNDSSNNASQSSSASSDDGSSSSNASNRESDSSVDSPTTPEAILRTPKRSKSSEESNNDTNVHHTQQPSQTNIVKSLMESLTAAGAIVPPLPSSVTPPSSSLNFLRRSSRSRHPHDPLLCSEYGQVLMGVGCAMKDPSYLGLNESGRPNDLMLATLKSSFPGLGNIPMSLNLHPEKGLAVTTRVAIPKHAFVLEYAGDLLTEVESDEAEARYANLPRDPGCYIFYFKHRRRWMSIDATAPGPGAPPGSQLDEHIKQYIQPTNAPNSPSPVVTTGAASPRLESLGFGYGRYLNHTRTPNLMMKIVDVPSTAIRTNRFDGSEPTSQTSSPSSSQASSSSSSPSPSSQPDFSLSPPSNSARSPTTTPPSNVTSRAPLNLHATYPRLCFFAKRHISPDEELTIDYGDRENVKLFPWLNN